MFVSSPLSFIENQCYDLLTTIADLTTVPDIDNHLEKAYKLYNLSQGLSSSLYQSLCDMDQFIAPSTARSDHRLSALTWRVRAYTANDVGISTPPAKWPGVNSLVALLSREKDDEAPHLRHVLAECFIAITMSLFCFALAAYDSRWLYRLVAHEMDAVQFSLIFGGGGDKKVRHGPPVRPPRPSAPRTRDSSSVPDAEALRSKLHAKVFGADAVQSGSSSGQTSPVVETTVTKWIPPQKNIVQFSLIRDELGVNFDSDDESGKSITSDLEEDRCVLSILSTVE
ncbi:hypothetical protein KIN20_013691 [Parelaphostrongylus tenuis]|uniref:Uncharacterized protein n=1 Tax=Parelaphostrongylus tenuis TaxID=148309 RepID=A0AAD5QMS4_PARTN|nr:hypothetical protein KIN20_013691 [Parelaphostrongylus tenuis]